MTGITPADRRAVAWLAPEGIYIIAPGMRVARGPFPDIYTAVDKTSKEIVAPYHLFYKRAKDVPDRYWPSRSDKEPKKPKAAPPPPPPATEPPKPARRQFPTAPAVTPPAVPDAPVARKRKFPT